MTETKIIEYIKVVTGKTLKFEIKQDVNTFALSSVFSYDDSTFSMTPENVQDAMLSMSKFSGGLCSLRPEIEIGNLIIECMNL